MGEPVTIAGAGGYVSAENKNAAPVEMEFLDGLHCIPAALVAHLGGESAIRSKTKAFKSATYKEFMTGFWRLVEKDQLNKAGASFIGGHLQSTGQGNPW